MVVLCLQSYSKLIIQRVTPILLGRQEGEWKFLGRVPIRIRTQAQLSYGLWQSNTQTTTQPHQRLKKSIPLDIFTYPCSFSLLGVLRVC